MTSSPDQSTFLPLLEAKASDFLHSQDQDPKHTVMVTAFSKAVWTVRQQVKWKSVEAKMVPHKIKEAFLEMFKSLTKTRKHRDKKKEHKEFMVVWKFLTLTQFADSRMDRRMVTRGQQEPSNAPRTQGQGDTNIKTYRHSDQ